jgi:hypothetical protein|nr:MAG TPA: hypothetical protein [Caudoviricetes sp.]
MPHGSASQSGEHNGNYKHGGKGTKLCMEQEGGQWMEVTAMRNPCKDCIYFHKENRTCQSKKCATGGSGKVSWVDKLFCSPCKKNGGAKR